MYSGASGAVSSLQYRDAATELQLFPVVVQSMQEEILMKTSTRHSYKLKPEKRKWNTPCAKSKPKKRKRKVVVEVFAENCTNCGWPMVSPSTIYEHKLSGKWSRLCSDCSQGHAPYKPKNVMTEI